MLLHCRGVNSSPAGTLLLLTLALLLESQEGLSPLICKRVLLKVEVCGAEGSCGCLSGSFRSSEGGGYTFPLWIRGIGTEGQPWFVY